MSVINTNVNAIIARNAGAVNERSMTKAMQQLSTGKRINVAADDAAGLAISTKMTSQVRGLDQAVRNANDGIALLQVAEGATVEMTNMLQRMRELAVQSRNDTNTSTERSYLDDEFQQLRQEIDRIASTTQWNGVNLMDGSGAIGAASSSTIGGRSVSFQVGANASQLITFNMGDFGTAAGPTADVNTFNLSSALAADWTNADQFVLAETGGATYTIDSSTISTKLNAVLTAATASSTGTDTTTLTAISEAQNTIESAIAAAGLTGFSATISVTTAAAATAPTAFDLVITDSQGRSFTADFLDGGVAIGNIGTAAQTTAGTASGQTGVFRLAALNSQAIDSYTGADLAVSSLDVALTALNAQRSAMGATINRLTYAADNLTNTSANVTAARSRVLDTDYASATTELARTQIIQQASTAMLAQANQGAQSVLSLLK